jgi:hypothetical protein
VWRVERLFLFVKWSSKIRRTRKLVVMAENRSLHTVETLERRWAEKRYLTSMEYPAVGSSCLVLLEYRGFHICDSTLQWALGVDVSSSEGD